MSWRTHAAEGWTVAAEACDASDGSAGSHAQAVAVAEVEDCSSDATVIVALVSIAEVWVPAGCCTVGGLPSRLSEQRRCCLYDGQAFGHGVFSGAAFAAWARRSANVLAVASAVSQLVAGRVVAAAAAEEGDMPDASPGTAGWWAVGEVVGGVVAHSLEASGLAWKHTEGERSGGGAHLQTVAAVAAAAAVCTVHIGRWHRLAAASWDYGVDP